jgi:anti-sigma regulatory factor (Ser/Thr protein kinase)
MSLQRAAEMATWPLCSYLELGALPTAAGCARKHARLLVAEWGLAELADTVELVVSELVTNSVQASVDLVGSRFEGRWAAGAPPVRMWLLSDCQKVLIRVWDGNDRLPELRALDYGSEGGRGLAVIEALCENWGVFRTEQSSGKVIWAVALSQ